MKIFNILFIFILNFKIIFCQFPPGYFFIRNNESNLVLDVKNSSKQPGSPIIIWTRNGNPNQLWLHDSSFLFNKDSGLVLEVSSYESGGNIAPGTKLIQAERRESPNNINQLWTYNYNYLMPYDPKVVLAAQGDNIQTGSLAVVDRAVGFPNNIRQQWAFDSP